MHVGSFEPTVMFFGMTNSPATFQTMMNEILRNLINKEKVAVFVDNMLVGTETEAGHNEIVEEVLKRLEENDLYVKLEKCVWKVRKIGFLELVIGPNGIEMEKKKVNRVLSWPEPKNIKDVRKFLGLANYYRRFINVRLANSKAGIKPTAPLSVFNKENSIEFPLDLVHYIYMQGNPNPVLLSCASL